MNDDESFEKGINVPGWEMPSWARHVGIPEMDYLTFLCYKIERVPARHEFNDVLFSLASVSSSPAMPNKFRVTIADSKLAYLRSEKAGSLEATGLANLSAESLAEVIAGRMGQNYVYNLRYNDERNQTMFNICLELPRVDGNGFFKLMSSLEFNAASSTLRLITFY